MDIPVAANILGTVGAICWSIQLIPQIVINYRRHNALGLQPSMMMLWASAGVPLGVYNIVEEFNVALRVQPQILTLLSLLTWIQCLFYEKQWSLAKALLVAGSIAILMGGIEVGLIIALRKAKLQELSWPLTLMAVLSALLLALGVLRHYVDIYQYRTVRGISFTFVAIDAAGDLFSLVSVLFQPKLDIQGMVIYATELILWIGVFACGGYLNLLPWLRTKRLRYQRRRAAVQIGMVLHELADNREEVMLDNDLVHNWPSSSSVFRTASNERDELRERVVSLIHNEV